MNEKDAETGEGKVLEIWHITPDVTPNNIVDIMKKNGFKDLSESTSESEPTMLLYKNDFVPGEFQYLH